MNFNNLAEPYITKKIKRYYLNKIKTKRILIKWKSLITGRGLLPDQWDEFMKEMGLKE